MLGNVSMQLKHSADSMLQGHASVTAWHCMGCVCVLKTLHACRVSYSLQEQLRQAVGIVGEYRYLRLAAVPDNTPLPMTMLSKLWRLSGEREAESCANLLQQLGIMRVAFLYDGSAWALVDGSHLKHLQVCCTPCRSSQDHAGIVKHSVMRCDCKVSQRPNVWSSSGCVAFIRMHCT